VAPLAAAPTPRVETPAPAPRLLTANRSQVFLRPTDLESLLPADHPARTFWACAERLDLAAFYAPIAAVEGEPGRPAIDPKILLTLWLYATSEGVGSARELARLCEAHDAYRWIGGGLTLNYHTLSDFRVAHRAALDRLLTEILAVLLQGGLVTLTRVAQDGTRVRASAGAASFRREKSLRRCLAEAEAQVQRCAAQDEATAAAQSARQAAAQARAARDRQARITQALAQLPAVRAAKRTEAERAEARVSTTDPEARVMKMADGGYRPAYNIQLATDTTHQVVVGVGVTNIGSDMGEAPPMVAAVQARCGDAPTAWLMDGGFAKHEAITQVAAQGVTVYAPVPQARGGGDPHVAHPGDSPAVVAWRARMATAEAKALYKERAATAECVNAQARNRGFIRLSVRGLAKVKGVAVLFALAHNLMRMASLAPEWVGIGTGPSAVPAMVV
jgi:transposase